MPSFTILSRRLILASLAGIGAILTIQDRSAGAFATGGSLWPAIGRRPHLVALGRCCAMLLPDMGAAAPRQLRQELAVKLQTRPGAGAALLESIKMDHLEAKTRIVDGWVFSETEILLAVLAFRTFPTTGAQEAMIS